MLIDKTYKVLGLIWRRINKTYKVLASSGTIPHY